MNPFLYQKLERISQFSGAGEVLKNIPPEHLIALVEDRGDQLTGIVMEAGEEFDASTPEGKAAFAAALTIYRAKVLAAELKSIETFIETVINPMDANLAAQLKDAVFSIGLTEASHN